MSDFPRPSATDATNATLFCDTPTGDPRERVAALAFMLDGLGADATRDLYLDVICPEREALRPSHPALYQDADWCVMFSCGLVARSHLRRLGARHPMLGLTHDSLEPYRTGAAVSDVQQAAIDLGAYIAHPSVELVTTPGVICLIGAGLGIHVLTSLGALSHTNDAGETIYDALISLDGGQPSPMASTERPGKTLECILRRKRSITVQNGRVFLHDGMGAREVWGAVDPNMLALEHDTTTDLVIVP